MTRIKDPKLLSKYRDDFCSVCGTPLNVSAHHLKTRGAGGDDVEANLMALCLMHHTEIHSYGMNKFVNKYPLVREILTAKGWYFDEDYKRWRMLN